jgi:DNA polymerase-3 subunit gamma/tau
VPSVSQSSAPQRSLYRRHRPRSFDDVVGQEAVVRTLRNAVELDRVNHAYLFVGSRGTGKTSLAKILAACLNCDQGPTSKPCGTCASCVAIAEARSLDVIEMDAASHNSVEDIRELRDSVAFQPLSGRWKVYILDEAHMLSSAAWNAFLKTLEEPPSFTVFVMATTEAQKVPATVIDRCHRFDFQRPTVEQVAKVIGRTAQHEGIEIPAEAIAALAKAANGSFRDALGALEQIVTYGGEEVALEDVLAVLGVAASETVEAVIDAVSASDAKALLVAIQDCVDGGRDLSALLSELEARARELLVVQTLGDVPRELSLTPEHDERLAEQARRIDGLLLTRLIDLLGFAVQVGKAGADVRTQLELALLKAARPEVDASTRALLARIERLEAGAPRSPREAREARDAREAEREPSREVVVESADAARPVPAAVPEVAQPVAAEPAAGPVPVEPASPEPAAERRASAPEPNPGEPAAGPTVAEPAVEPVATEPAAEPAAAEPEVELVATEPAAEPAAAEPEVELVATEPAAKPAAGGPAAEPAAGGPATEPAAGGPATEPAAAEPARSGPASLNAPAGAPQSELRDDWPAIVALVREGNALLGAVIEESVPLRVTDGELTIGFPQSSSFNKRKAEAAANKEALSAAIATLSGQRLRLAFELREDLESVDGDGEGEDGGDELLRTIITELNAEELSAGGSPGGAEKQEGA